MKILRVCDSYYPDLSSGGPAVVDYETDKLICREYNQMCIFTKQLTLLTHNENELERSCINYYQLLRYLRHCDVIILSTVWSLRNILVCILTIFARKRIILVPHGALNEYIKVKKKIYWYFIMLLIWRKQTDIVFASNYEKLKFEKYWMTRSKIYNIRIVPFGFPISSQRKNLKHQKDLLRLSYIGRAHPIKNLEGLVPLIRTIASYRRVQLNIVGDFSHVYGKWLLQYLQLNSIDVAYHGELNRAALLEYLNSVDLGCIISKSENFSAVFAEYVYSDTPIIISGQIGAAEYMQESKLVYSLEDISDQKAFDKFLTAIIDGECKYTDMEKANITFRLEKFLDV